jgi:hypothetical protein
MATGRLDSHLQALLDVQPVHELVIELPALPLQERVETSAPVAHATGGQVPKSDPKFGPTVANAHVPMHGTREAQRSARATFADAVSSLQPLHHDLPTIGP